MSIEGPAVRWITDVILFRASHAIYGTPPAYTAAASLRFSAATSAAAEQLELAKKRVSDQVASATGKEPWHVEMEKSVESAYSGAVAQASSRFNEALKLTDSARNAVYPTQGVLESISSVASSRLSEAQAEATKQYADITGHYFFSC